MFVDDGWDDLVETEKEKGTIIAKAYPLRRWKGIESRAEVKGPASSRIW